MRVGAVIVVGLFFARSFAANQLNVGTLQLSYVAPPGPAQAIQTITTSASSSPTTTNITVNGNAVRIWSGETPFAENSFNLYYRRNGGSVQTVKMTRWQGRILNAVSGDAISLGTDDGRVVEAAYLTVPAVLISSFPTNNTANCDKAGPPLWAPSNAHIILPGNFSAFQIASNQQERVVFISEFDGTTWSYPRWVWTQTNYNVTVQCNYSNVALANYDGAALTVNCPAGSLIGGTSNYMMFALPAVTGTSRNVSTVAQFHAAIQAAVAGDEIVVADGTYQLTNQINAASFTANNGVNGNKGASGIIIRSQSGNRDAVWITGTNGSADCGWTLTQTGATNCTYFKGLTFAATNVTWDLVVTDGQFKFGNVRITGASLQGTGFQDTLVSVYGTSVVDFVQCQVDNSAGDCYDNFGTSSMRLIGCSGFTSGTNNYDQICSSHAGSFEKIYGSYLSNAGQNVSQNDTTSSNLLYFCRSDPGARVNGGYQGSSLFGSLIYMGGQNIANGPPGPSSVAFLSFNHIYITNVNALFDAAISTPITHNYLNGITNSGTYFIDTFSDSGTTNIVGNISVGAFQQWQNVNPATTNTIQYWNNTLSGNFTGFRNAGFNSPFTPAAFTNNATLGLSQSVDIPNISSTQVSTNKGDYNVFCGITNYYDAYVSPNPHDTFATAGMSSTTFIPTSSGNCDGNGANIYSYVGDSDPYGFVFLYLPTRTPRGARDIPAIYANAVMFPDYY